MKKVCIAAYAGLIFCGAAFAEPASWAPEQPSRHEPVTITLHDFSPGDVLHWGVNVDGRTWVRAIDPYRPSGSTPYGNATRTAFVGSEQAGVGHVVIGPFNNTNQVVGAVVFAISRADGSWDNNRGQDYHIPISSGRIRVQPAEPTANDVIEVTVHDSLPGGQLRWGVNAEREKWTPVNAVYWPDGTVPAEDNVGVDSPLPDPDEHGRSVIQLGPFDRAEQVVASLHMAVHWDDVWDTDGGRNYNTPIQWRDPDDPHGVRIVSPSDTSVANGTVQVEIHAPGLEQVELWLGDARLDTLTGPEFRRAFPIRYLAYGPHTLTARAIHEEQVKLDTALFWHVPLIEEKPLPEGVGYGATDHEDGTVTFALYAPGKKFVSLVGNFNAWDPDADRMHVAPDGTWWITRDLEPGVYLYQYDIDGMQRLADPYARQVDWTNEDGLKGWKPADARTVLAVGATPFEWTATDYERPSLEEMVVYELYIEDFAPGAGFDGVIAKLDYIADLGVNAIEPLPWHPWPGRISWGYNPAFHFGVEQTYGTPDDLKRLIDEAHKRGLAVIIDMVLNHAEWGSALYQLYGDDYEANPYFREYHGHNWGFPKIDQESPAVKRYVADVIRFWIEEYRVDGFRYDATRWTGWQGYNDWGASWFAYAARQADPQSIQIAEHLPIEPPLITDTEMDTGWHAEYRWRLREMITRAELNPDAFAEAMDGRRVGFEHSFQRMPYTESHDEERVVRELRDAGFSEEEVLRRAELALAITLTTPGVPMLYAGQEFGEDTLKHVGWNPLQWDLLDQEPGRRLHAVTRALARLRATHPALRADNARILAADPTTGLALYERDATPHLVQVAANFGRDAVDASVYLHSDAVWMDALNDTPAPSGVTELILQPGEVRVWATQPHEQNPTH